MNRVVGVLVFILPFSQVWLLCGQTLSQSKLSAHLINAYTAGGSNIISAHPRVLKVLGLDSGFPTGMAQAMRDYRAAAPGGKIVVRIYSPKTYSLADNATSSANDFWTNVLQQGLSYLSPSDRAMIDFLEGPNEGQTPTLGYPGNAPLQASQWFNQFWTNLMPLMIAAGYKPCIGSIAVGNPGGTPAQMQSYLAAFVPALRQAKAAGGAWSYHAYTINYTTDEATEIWYSLRYRQFYSYFASAYTDLNSMPLILTEGGVDQSGTPATSGWQARGTAADYQHWLNWFDQQMQQDAYVMGCTLFEIGNPESWGWPSFDLEPIAGWLGNFLITPLAVPPAPSGLVAHTVPGSVTLTWTNAPLNPTRWIVKRGNTSGGPYAAFATNVTTGVQATTYTDTAITNAQTYYYVVSGVNAAGEGPTSSEVYASLTAPAAINCGGGTLSSFQSDAFFDIGTAFSTSTGVDTSAVVNPAPMAVYQSHRYGNVTYTIPFLPADTSYKLRLHFAEIYWNTTGQRVFNVLVNGVQVLTNFDVVRTAGAAFKANVQEVNAISDTNGVITIRLVSVVDNAALNGIELIPNPTNAIPAAPGNVTAAVGNALVTLAWSVPAGATSFNLKRGTSSAGPYSVIASNLTQATYRDPSFTPNTTYYYVVSAQNALGESPNSGVVSARPTNGLPDVVVTSVSWTPPTIYTGRGVVFSARVVNRGSAATPSGVVLGVGFVVDGGGTASWSGSYTTSLAPGASVQLTADGGPSGGNTWPSTAGPHTVTATVDDVNRFPESIEDNNSTSASFTVLVSSYNLNCGGPAAGSFSADANYNGSGSTLTVTNSIDTSGASGPAPVSVYQSQRSGDFWYVLNNLYPGSNCTVRLHFAEIADSINNAGERRFNVAVNGEQLLTDFDVLAVAGGKYKALTRDVKMRADSTGTLLVQFTKGSAGDAICNGIQVLGATLPPRPTITDLELTNGLAGISWQASIGGIYQVQCKDDLGQMNWTALTGLMLCTGSPMSTNVPAGQGQRFFRIQVQN